MSRPKKYVCDAERQKAYRQRQKTKYRPETGDEKFRRKLLAMLLTEENFLDRAMIVATLKQLQVAYWLDSYCRVVGNERDYLQRYLDDEPILTTTIAEEAEVIREQYAGYVAKMEFVTDPIPTDPVEAGRKVTQLMGVLSGGAAHGNYK